MEIITRRVKSLLKRLQETPEPFDTFMLDVLKSYLTNQLSAEQAKVAAALLEKEGYLSNQ
jgi:hypothetical protein